MPAAGPRGGEEGRWKELVHAATRSADGLGQGAMATAAGLPGTSLHGFERLYGMSKESFVDAGDQQTRPI